MAVRLAQLPVPSRTIRSVRSRGATERITMPDKNKAKVKRLTRRKYGIRNHLMGTGERPRLTVFPSVKHIYAQVIDDIQGRTLVSAGTLGKTGVTGEGKTGDMAAAAAVGKALAERARAAGVTK